MTFKICTVLGAQRVRSTGFRRAQGNQHCAKFESHTNIVTFETNAISITSSIHASVLKLQVNFNFNGGQNLKAWVINARVEARIHSHSRLGTLRRYTNTTWNHKETAGSELPKMNILLMCILVT